MKCADSFSLGWPVQDAVRFEHSSSQVKCMIQLVVLDIVKKDQYDGVPTLFNSLLKSMIHLKTEAKITQKYIFSFMRREKTNSSFNSSRNSTLQTQGLDSNRGPNVYSIKLSLLTLN